VDVNLAQWGGSLLTNQSVSFTANAALPSRPAHYVPGRNTVFIAIALSLAEAKGYDSIYMGFSSADVNYPDTQQPYLDAFATLAALASRVGISGKAPQLIAPLVHCDKVGIVRRALQFEVPISDTWSCYYDGEVPCGSCGACYARDFALIKAGRPDLATAKGRSRYSDGIQRATRTLWRFMLVGSESA
jgi:7-cyano-7-deazaguanine synthase